MKRSHLNEAAHPLHPDTAEACNLVGVQAYVDGKLGESNEVMRGCLAIAQATLRPDHPAIATYLKSLAYSTLDMGDVAEARVLLERSMEIVDASARTPAPIVAIHFIDLAGVLFLQADYEQARRLYEEAKSIDERVYGPYHGEVTTIIFNLGLVAASAGDLSDAGRRFTEAAQNWAHQFGPEHPFVALALTAHGETLANAGRDREAVPFFEKALAIRKRVFPATHPMVGKTLSALGTSLARTGALQRASLLSQEALRIFENSDAPDAVALADALVLRADILVAEGDVTAARRMLERAVEVRDRSYGASHPRSADARIMLAGLLARGNLWAESWKEAITAEEATRENRRLTLRYLPERQALEFASAQRKGLDIALSYDGIDAPITTRTLDAVIRSRALVLDELGARRQSLRDADPKTVKQWDTLSAHRQRFANLVTRGPGSQKLEEFAALVDQVRLEKERAERELADSSITFRTQELETEIGLAQVCAELQPDDVLVSFVRYDRTVVASSPGKAPAFQIVPSYGAFVLRRCESAPVFVRLGAAERTDALVEEWRRRVTDSIRPASESTPAERPLRTIGVSLRVRIWDPLRAQLLGVRRVFIVPDGSLSLLPFAALPMESGKYLIEDGPLLHYLSAERDLVKYRETPRRSQTLLSVGGPSYFDASSFAKLSKTPVATLAFAAPAAPIATFRGGPSRCPGFQSMTFRELPGSRVEAQTIADLWRTLGGEGGSDFRNADLLTGAAATEHSVKTLGPGHGVLHIATHGFFLGSDCPSATTAVRSVGGLVSIAPKSSARPASVSRSDAKPENPLLLSGLAFAGANRRSAAGPDEDDGILTAEEVAALNLEGNDWVVLSACDTGLGTVAAGEGVLGLRRAFQIAGARTVIMSLWAVEDRSARQWMGELYGARLDRNLDTALAMREAALRFIQARRAKGQSSHPFYWAGFVAAGDWH